MRSLILLRHGQADDTLDDFSRALTTYGRDEVLSVTKQIQQAKIVPDHILASAALRTQQTGEYLHTHLALKCAMKTSLSLYLASNAHWLQQLYALPETLHHVVFVGHNPGISYLAHDLLSENDLPMFKTAEAWVLSCEADWVFWPVSKIILRDRFIP